METIEIEEEEAHKQDTGHFYRSGTYRQSDGEIEYKDDDNQRNSYAEDDLTDFNQTSFL